MSSDLQSAPAPAPAPLKAEECFENRTSNYTMILEYRDLVKPRFRRKCDHLGAEKRKRMALPQSGLRPSHIICMSEA